MLSWGEAPRARFSIQAHYDGSGRIVGEFFLDSSDSFIPGEKIVSHTWALSSGKTYRGRGLFLRLHPGDYSLKLTVASKSGKAVSSSRKITVAAQYRADEISSPVSATLKGYDENQFHPTVLSLQIHFDGLGIDPKTEIDVMTPHSEGVFSETSVVKKLSILSTHEVEMEVSVRDGWNELRFVGFDPRGHMIQKDFSFFAGNRQLSVRVSGRDGLPVTDGVLKVVDIQSGQVFQDFPIKGSQFFLTNLPRREVYLYFLRSDGDFSGQRLPVDATRVELSLRGFRQMAKVSNPDFLQGLAGWKYHGQKKKKRRGERILGGVFDRGESAEYSHAFITSKRYLYYAINSLGYSPHAYVDIILRNYTQKTVSIHSYLGRDLEHGVFRDYRGGLAMESEKGDRVEIIVQFMNPKMGASILDDSPLQYLDSDFLSTDCGGLQEDVYDLYGDAKGRPVAESLLNYLSLGAGLEGRHENTLYLLSGECEVLSLALESGGQIFAKSWKVGKKQVWFQKEEAIFEGFSFREIDDDWLKIGDGVNIVLSYKDEEGVHKRRLLRRISPQHILQWYPAFGSFGLSDANPYDRGDKWVNRQTKQFLDGVGSHGVGESLLINDVSNINGGIFYGHREHREGLDMDFILLGSFHYDDIFSFHEFEGIRHFIEGIGEDHLFIERIIASQNLTSEGHSFVNYSCIQNSPATTYIKNDLRGHHFNHWHLDVSRDKTGHFSTDQWQRPLISYRVETQDDGLSSHITLLDSGNSLYSLLFLTPKQEDLNGNPHLFTKAEGTKVWGSVGGVTYSFDPTSRPQIIVSFSSKEAKSDFEKYGIRVTRFDGSSTYSLENFSRLPCTVKDIELSEIFF